VVVRLGQTSEVQVVNSQRYRIRQGQRLSLDNIATHNVATVRSWARVRYDNGEDDILFIPDFTTSNDGVQVRPADALGGEARMDGWVVDALVELPLDLDVKRGEIYVKLFMDPFGPVLCSDYLFSSFGQVVLGTYIQAGPGGGAGFLEISTFKASSVPVASSTLTFADPNVIRKVYGFAWYYVASVDVASRTLALSLVQPLGALPTGWAYPTPFVNQQSLSVTAGQDAIIFADHKRSGTFNDGTLLIDSTATDPSDFPILVEEDDPYYIDFLVGSLNANDRDAIYVQQESWVIGL